MARRNEPNRNGSREHRADDVARIWAEFREPLLRWGDVPGGSVLAEQRMLSPQDPYLQDLHAHVARDQAMKAMMSGDPFYGNSPPAGTLPPLAPGRIPIAALSTGEVLSIAVSDVMKNLLIVGPTGGGKTNFIRILIAAVLEAQP
jgi:hypothetical protein